MSRLATPDIPPSDQDPQEPTRWIIHGERLIDDSRRLRLSIAQVELPDGVHFEQYVLRMPKAAITVVFDDTGERVVMIWRHRFCRIAGPGSCPEDMSIPTKTLRSRQRARLRRRPAGVPAR